MKPSPPRDPFFAAAPTKVVKEWSSDKQEWLYSRGPYPTLLVGGQNSGKTTGCVLKALTLLQTYPGSRIAIIRRSATQLAKTTMESFFQWCTPGFFRPYGGFNQNSGVLDLNNGSRAYFLHLDQPDSLDVLAGLELNFAYVSQVEEISEKAWDLLDVRCGRWTGAHIPNEILDSYPGGRAAWPWRAESDPNIRVPPRYIFAEGYVTDETHWLYLRFADESPERAKWKALGYACKIVESADNKFAIREVINALYAKDPDYVRRYVKPQWGNPEGALFNVSPLSLLQPTPALLNRVRLYMRWRRALDHGDSAPTCCGWLASDADDNIFVVREYYQPNLLVTQHRKNIFELGRNDPPYQTNYADPSIFAKSRGRSATKAPEWSIADEWRDQHIGDPRTAISWQPSENDEHATVSRMKEFLFVDPNHRHPITNELGAPHLYFIVATEDYPNGCSEILKDIRAQRRKSIAVVGDVKVFTDERDDTVRDHGYDCLTPEARILKADLTWCPIGTAVVGDRLLAFDEDGPKGLGGRKWRFSVVTHTARIRKPCYRLTFSDGTVVTCSSDHQWLTRGLGGRNVFWQTAESLDGRLHRTKGRKRDMPAGDAHVVKAIPVYEDLRSNDSGYLAAAFDGEGCLGAQLMFAQRANPMLEHVVELLRRLGFAFAVSGKGRSDCLSLHLRGGFREILRFLMLVRPVRLIPKLLDGQRLKTAVDTVAVVNREFIGDQEVVALTTTTHTFIAEGLASHNCVKYDIIKRPAPASPSGPPPTPPGQIAIQDYEKAGAEARRKRLHTARTRTGVRYGF